MLGKPSAAKAKAMSEAESARVKAQAALEDGNVDLALEYSMEACSDVLDTLEQSAAADDANSLKRMQIVMVTSELTTRARTAAELAISLMNALWAVKGM